MPAPSNPQRVPLAKTADGRVAVYIEREWLRAFQELSGQTSSSSSSTISTASLLALVNALTVRVSALEAKVAELELGYHV